MPSGQGGKSASLHLRNSRKAHNAIRSGHEPYSQQEAEEEGNRGGRRGQGIQAKADGRYANLSTGCSRRNRSIEAITHALTGHNRQEGTRGDGEERWEEGPYVSWEPRHQEVWQEMRWKFDVVVRTAFISSQHSLSGPHSVGNDFDTMNYDDMSIEQ